MEILYRSVFSVSGIDHTKQIKSVTSKGSHVDHAKVLGLASWVGCPPVFGFVSSTRGRHIYQHVAVPTARMIVPLAGSEAVPDPLSPPGATLGSRRAVSEAVPPVPIVIMTESYGMC